MLKKLRASLVAQLVKNPPVMRETWVRSLGWEDPLEKRKDTHSSILAWRIPWTESPWGRKESDRTEQLSLSLCCCPRIHKGALDQASATGPGWIKGALALEEYFSNWRVIIYYYPMNFIWWMIILLKKTEKNIM